MLTEFAAMGIPIAVATLRPCISSPGYSGTKKKIKNFNICPCPQSPGKTSKIIEHGPGGPRFRLIVPSSFFRCPDRVVRHCQFIFSSGDHCACCTFLSVAESTAPPYSSVVVL